MAQSISPLSSQSSPQEVQRLVTAVEVWVLHLPRSHFLCFCHLRANSIFQSIARVWAAEGGCRISVSSKQGLSIGWSWSPSCKLETLERIGHPRGLVQTDEYMDGKWRMHSFCQIVFSRFKVSHRALEEFSQRQTSMTSRHDIVLNHNSAGSGKLSRSNLTTTSAARVGSIKGELDLPVAFFEVRCSRCGTTSRARPFLWGILLLTWDFEKLKKHTSNNSAIPEIQSIIKKKSKHQTPQALLVFIHFWETSHLKSVPFQLKTLPEGKVFWKAGLVGPQWSTLT